MDEDLYKHKAKERLNTAKWCLSRGYLSSCASNLYFAYFNYFQHVIGTPPKGKWEHIGIAKAFIFVAFRTLNFQPSKLRRIKQAYEDLYKYRLIADYSPEGVSETASALFEEYIDLLSEVMNREGQR